MATLNASTFSSQGSAVEHYLTLIDEAAAKARHIDPSLAEIYRDKLAQAKAGGGPLLDAEAATLGADVDIVRQAVLRNHQRRQTFVNRIELARVKAKSEVRGATTAADMHRIHQQFQGAL